MENFTPSDNTDGYPLSEAEIGVPAGIDAGQVDAIDLAFTPLRRWPSAIADLYFEEIVQRLYREQHFLFLLGLFMCLATIAVDMIVNPGMAKEGAVLRILVVAPLTLVGLTAGARGWSRVLAFCVGASPIAFIAVVVHLSIHLPPEIASRYLYSAILLVGLSNIIMPYSLRGLVIFDISALLAATAMIALGGAEGMIDALAQHADILVVFMLVAGATLPIAARFEKLRQSNFLLTLRARISSRELLKANRALHVLSQSDPLTGIANRRGFENQFETEIVAPGESGRGSDFVALMMIDLDFFKTFNDTHGHQAGDLCLQLVASALVEIMDGVDGIVARYGGEEFVAALRTREQAVILAMAEEIRQTIATVLTPVNDSDRSLVTASIGVGIARASAMLPREELIEMADAALYSGKDRGRNRVEVVEAEVAFGIRQ